MFWYNETLVEFNLVQHQISFSGSSDVRLSFAQHHLSRQNESDVGLGLITQVFNVTLPNYVGRLIGRLLKSAGKIGHITDWKRHI